MAQAARPMAMVSRAAIPGGTEVIKPNWSAEARLPQTIRLPVQVTNAVFGVGSGRREIVVRREGEPLPALIIEWMQSTPQYRTWFLQEPILAPEATQPDPVVEDEQPAEDEPQADVDAEDKPKRQRRKKTADKE